MSTTESAVARYFHAWNARDPDACAACFVPDGVREWMIVSRLGGPTRFEGREAIAEAIRGFMQALPDIHVSASARAEPGDDTVWVEWTVTGTHTGDWGPWSAQDEPVDFPGVSIYALQEGLIREERMHFDPNVMTRA